MGTADTYSGLKHHFGDTIGGLRVLINMGIFLPEKGIEHGQEFTQRLGPFLDKVASGECPVRRDITLEKLQELRESMANKEWSSEGAVQEAYREVYALLGEEEP